MNELVNPLSSVRYPSPLLEQAKRQYLDAFDAARSLPVFHRKRRREIEQTLIETRERYESMKADPSNYTDNPARKPVDFDGSMYM